MANWSCIWCSASSFFGGSSWWGDCLISRVPSWTRMLCSTKLFILTSWSFWLNTVCYRVSDSAKWLTCSLVTPSWQALWNIASKWSGTLSVVGVHISDLFFSFPPSLCFVNQYWWKFQWWKQLPTPEVGWWGWCITRLCNPQLLASTTLSLSPLINPFRAWLCNVRRQESLSVEKW